MSSHFYPLTEFALIAMVAVATTLIFARLKLPVVSGLLVAGILMGPHALGVVSSTAQTEAVAEIGVVFLLFTIGLEFSIRKLRTVFGRVLIGGMAQIVLTAGLTTLVVWAAGQPLAPAIFFGFICSLSSTAIVLRTLADRQELDAPHGRFVVATLLLQDLCMIPMMLTIPLLEAQHGSSMSYLDLLIALGISLLVVLATFILARRVVPRLLAWVDASRSREMFLLAVLAICLGTAWSTAALGLSVALGAFLGGVMVADTEFGHRAMSDILPLRDAFVSLFFVSLGMLCEPQVAWHAPLQVAVAFLAFVFVKGFLATVAAVLMKFPARTAWLAGVGLAQFSEFGFVLVRMGEHVGLVDRETTGPILLAGVLSMLATPLLVRAAPHVTAGERLVVPLGKLIGVPTNSQIEALEPEMKDHVVVVGQGNAGRITVDALSRNNIPSIVLEINAETVKDLREQGVRAFYGDASSAEVLRLAHLESARALVILINDGPGIPRIIAAARRLAPNVPIFTRVHYAVAQAEIRNLGAHEVVVEEIEGAVEIVSLLLHRLAIPERAIAEQLAAIRRHTS